MPELKTYLETELDVLHACQMLYVLGLEQIPCVGSEQLGESCRLGGQVKKSLDLKCAGSSRLDLMRWTKIHRRHRSR